MEGIVIGKPGSCADRETVSDFHAFYGADGDECFCTNILRAANDVRYPMVCSIISMLGLRLVAGYILAVHFGMGAIGIWIAMIGDWLCRSICFFLRLKSEKWLRYAPGLRVAAGQK